MSDLSNHLVPLQEKPKVPHYTDFQVLAIRDRELEKDKNILYLKLVDPQTREPLCDAIIYSREWFPGMKTDSSFSHYLSVLRFCYAGLASEGKDSELLLQIMKAVWYPGKTAEESTDGTAEPDKLIILKFIISPDHNITGAELESTFNCPAKFFYESFLGLQRSIRRAPTSIAFVRGNAIHKGTQYAANEWVRSNDPIASMKSYHRAVIDEWRDNFDVLIRRSYKRGPNKDLRLPIEVDSIIVDRIAEKFQNISEKQLLNECLLFSPDRGISGRADQIILKDTQDELWEIKTGTRYFLESDFDPLSGVTHPGGVQAFAYHNIIKNVLGQIPKAFIEFFDASAGLDDDNPEIIPLEEHAIIVRRKIDITNDQTDEYLDLLLQTRNIAFAIESGLLSGYDRYKISQFLSRRYMPALGTDFSLLSSNWRRICSYCPSNQQGICSDGKRLYDPNLWLHFPQELYEYWAWYFRQLRFELNTVKRHLHKLATTNLDSLANQGITIHNLKQKKFDPYRYILTLSSKDRIFTRIREGDAVFVTPTNLKPGEIFSVEGQVNSITSNEVVIKARSTLKTKGQAAKTFRVDQVQNVIFSKWQTRSLTDFLFEAMNRSGVLGRKLSIKELPYLPKLLLGFAKPRKITPIKRSRLLQTLDKFKVSAIEKALGLQPGDILLVQGPPGSGKTRMISQLAKELFNDHYLLPSALVTEGSWDLPKPVLILANTHRAADEVVAKLSSFEKLKPYIIRLESYSKDHPEVVQDYIIPNRVNYSDDLTDKADPKVLVSLLNKGIELYKQAGIIVGTLGSVGSNLLKGLKFQWVIVDEAGQATEPATLGAFRHLCPENEDPAGYPRVVLVGDHKQLPPVVSEEIVDATPAVPKVLLKAGLSSDDTLKVSLFERLFRLWGEKADNVIILSEQYRMNEAISRIVRQSFYPSVNYIPANDSIGNHTLVEFYEEEGITTEAGKSYSELTSKLLDPDYPVVFINTENDDAALEGVEAVEIQTESRFNIREAKIIAQIIADFLQAYSLEKQQLLAEQMGVISPYRHQNNLIYAELRAKNVPEKILEHLRVDTVDRFQGDERELIFLSLTNSNDDHIIGQLHQEWRRMNVSISRAKAKLLIIGNKRTFLKASSEKKEREAKTIYKKLFETIDALKQEQKAREFASEKHFTQNT